MIETKVLREQWDVDLRLAEMDLDFDPQVARK
jgi:hypothetical protein